jgi:O-antigen ligase
LQYAETPQTDRTHDVAAWSDRIGHAAVLGMAASLTVSRALFHVCAVIMAVCWLIGGHYRQMPNLLRNSPPVAACTALVLLVLASGLYTSASVVDWLVQVKAYAKLLVVPMMLAFLQRREQIERGWLALGFGLLLLWLFFTLDLWIDIPGTRSARTQDQGVFNNYIVEGLNLATLALIGFAAGLHNWKRRRWLAVAFFLGGLAGAHAVVFVNPGRGAQLALIGGLLVFALFALPQRVRWTGFLAVLVVVSAAVSESDVMASRFKIANDELKALGAGPQHSVGPRLAAWHTSLELWIEEPLLGHGAGSYSPLVSERQPARLGGCINNPVCEQPHNQYFYLMVEAGLAGLLIFGWILISVARSGRSSAGMAHVLAPSFGILFAIHSCFDSGLRMGTQIFVFLVMTALLAAEQLQRHAARSEKG